MRVYIGHDRREKAAFDVAAASLRRRASVPAEVIPLREDRLAEAGLFRRVVDRRDGLYDFASASPQSTEFANSRFFVPLLGHAGWVLFVDCDVVFLQDVARLFALADDSKAIMVVKHQQIPAEATKMDGVVQTHYSRKNWSSVMLVNCDHPAHRRLTMDALAFWPGRALHAFRWLHDDEIGALPREWNWLVGVEPRPTPVGIAHFTLGGPWLRDWVPAPHDELWLEEARQ